MKVNIVLLLFLYFCVANGTLHAGGGGRGLRFDRNRADVVGVDWVTPTTDAVTVEFWVWMFDYHQQTHGIFSYSEVFYDENGNLHSAAEGLTLKFELGSTAFCRGQSCLRCTDSNCPIQAVNDFGTWIHFAASWDSATGNVFFYRNAVQVANFTGAAVSEDVFRKSLTPLGCLVIGYEVDSYCGGLDPLQQLDAVFDEFRLWDYARTQTEIAQDFQRTVSPDTVGLNIYYRFNDPSETQFITDLSGSSNRGMMGRLPNHEQQMVYISDLRSNTGPGVPPYTHTTSAPLVGEEPLHFFATSVMLLPCPVEFRAFDNESLPIEIRLHTPPTAGMLLNMADQNIVYTPGDLIGMTLPGTPFPDSNWAYYVVGLPPPGTLLATDTFQYNASNGVDWIIQDIFIHPMQIDTPNDLNFTGLEDSSILLPLGALNTGNDVMPCVVKITSLPSKGTLYQGGWGNPPVYGYYNFSTLIPVSVNDTGLDERSVFFFFPDADEFSEPGVAYASFTFTWVHYALTQEPYKSAFETEPTKKAPLISSEATVQLFIESVNDAPVPSDDFVSVNATNSTVMLQFNAIDSDNSPQGKVLYQVTQFPKFGDLYQVMENGTQGTILSSETVPIVRAWVHDVLNVSSQFSLCWNQLECAGVRYDFFQICSRFCPILDYHAVNLIGPPVTFPAYGEAPTAWEAAEQSAGFEFLELLYDFELYVTGIEIFENLNPGAVTAIKSTENYTYQTTVWNTLWSAARDDTIGEVVRQFIPPLCFHPSPVQAIRIEMDTSKPGISQIDGIKLLGGLQLPEGKITNSNAKLMYVPQPGIHFSGDPTQSLDYLKFKANDCYKESTESATVQLQIAAPSVVNSSLLSSWLVSGRSSADTRPLVLMDVETEAVRTDLATRLGVAITSDPAVLIVAAIGGNAIAPNIYTLADNTTPVSLPRYLPSNDTQYYAQLGTDELASTISVWVTYDTDFGNYTYRISHSLVFKCPKGSQRVGDSCSSCPIGYYSDTQHAIECKACLKGYWSITPGAAFCDPCSAGTYKNFTGPGECNPCPIGTFAKKAGSSVCTDCSDGLYSDSPGLTECLRCPVTQYGPSSRQNLSECLNCPANTHSLFQAATDIADCVCKPGFYSVNGSGVACLPCVTGAVCDGGTTAPTALPMWWASATDSLVFSLCASEAACPGGSAGTCSEGFEGLRCAKCQNSYYFNGEVCKKCVGGGSGAWKTALGLFVLLCLAIMMFRVLGSKGGRMNARVALMTQCGIIITFLQTIDVFATLQVNWPVSASQMMDFFSFLNFNVNLLSLECYSSGTDNRSTAIAGVLLLPIIFAGMLGLVSAAWFLKWKFYDPKHQNKIQPASDDAIDSPSVGKSQDKYREKGEGDKTNMVEMTNLPQLLETPEPPENDDPLFLPSPRALANQQPCQADIVSDTKQTVSSVETWQQFKESTLRRYVNSMGVFCMGLFLMLITKTLAVFSCYSQPDGSRTLWVDTSISCYDSTWRESFLPWGIIGILLYFVCFPILLAWVLWSAKDRTNLYTEGTIVSYFRFIVSRYKSKYYYWEIFVFCRKVVIGMVVSSLEGKTVAQLCIAFLVLFISLALQVHFRPFLYNTNNVVEEFFLSCSLMVVFVGVFFYADSDNQLGTSAAFRAILLVLIVLFLIAIVLVIGWAFFVALKGIDIFEKITPNHFASFVHDLSKTNLAQLLSNIKACESEDEQILVVESLLIMGNYTSGVQTQHHHRRFSSRSSFTNLLDKRYQEKKTRKESKQTIPSNEQRPSITD